MKTKLIWAISILICALVIPAGYLWAKDQGHLAVIISVQGEGVKVKLFSQGGKEMPAAMGLELSNKDTIITPAAGSCSIMFDTGEMVKVAPKSSLIVGTYSKSSKSPGGIYKKLAAAFFTEDPQEDNLAALGGVRAVDKLAPQLLFPKEATILSEKPAFQWSDTPGARGYVLSLIYSNAKVFKKETKQSRIEYPANFPALKPGETYFWEVEAVLDETKKSSNPATFDIANADVKQYINDAQTTLVNDLSEQERRFVLAKLYARYRLFHEAVNEYRKLLESNPSSAFLYEQLGNIYIKMCWTDMALENLTKAVEINPNSKKVHEKLSDLYLYMGQEAKSKAEEDIAKKMSMDDNISSETAVSSSINTGRWIAPAAKTAEPAKHEQTAVTPQKAGQTLDTEEMLPMKSSETSGAVSEVTEPPEQKLPMPIIERPAAAVTTSPAKTETAVKTVEPITIPGQKLRVIGYNIYRNGVKINTSIVTSTTFKDSGLTGGTNYSYQVAAVFLDNTESGKSNVAIVFLKDTTPPRAPTGLKVVVPDPAAGTALSLSWDANSEIDLSGYNVYRNGAKINKTPVTKTEYTDTGLAKGTIYSYTIRACDTSCNESLSSNTISGIFDVPGTPHGLAAVSGNKAVFMTWNPNSEWDLSGYNVYRDGKKLNTAVLNRTSYQDTNLTNGSIYGYQMSAVNSFGSESVLSPILKIKPEEIAAAAPVLKSTTGSDGLVDIIWTAISDKDSTDKSSEPPVK